MKTSDKTDVIFKLLFKVKQELGPVTKGSVNPHFKNSFADLNTHIETIEPVLEKHGMFMLQPVSVNEHGTNIVSTTIIHAESGQWISSEMALINTPDMQKLLAAVTYARRGSQNSMFGLASVDDDGETSVGRGAPVKSKGNWNKPKAKSETKVEPKQESSVETKEVKPFTRPQSNGKSSGILM